MQRQVRQIARDRVKRGVIDVAQRIGRLQTPMTQLLGVLDAYEALRREMSALELFGMHGLWHTRDYVKRCEFVEFYELDPTYAAYAARTVPNSDVVVGDCIRAVKAAELRRSTYDFVVADNPYRAPYLNDYTEHFDLFPELLGYIDDGVLVLNFLPASNDFSEEHARRRELFYGKVRPSIDEGVAVYQEHLASAGLRSSKHLYTFRSQFMGYLTFVCKR